MPTDTLELVLPDWANLDTEFRSPLPFALWTIGDQCLLHHWLDHAVNEGATSVRIHAADRPAAVRKVVDESLLWPVQTELCAIPSVSAAPTGAHDASWLPGSDPPSAPASGWDMLERAAKMEEVWLDRLAASPDFPLLGIGFSCRIHPEAKLVPPYFIGDHVFIGPGCEIGPYAVIGPGSVVSGANVISHSHLSAHSYLGPVTALHHCRLESGVLFNLKHRARLDNLEPHLVSSLKKNKAPVPLRDRIQALLLSLRLGSGERSGETFQTFDGRTLPGTADAGLSNRLAWLPLVWKGELPLYGVLPRTNEQLSNLDPDWQNVLRHAPIGVFSYADSQGCHHPSDPDEALHAVYQASLPPETLAGATRSFIRNLKSGDMAQNIPST